MKQKTRAERTPARTLSSEELETGVLAAGCCTQGCCGSLDKSSWVINPAYRTTPVLNTSLLPRLKF
jgi:hypothetical protein